MTFLDLLQTATMVTGFVLFLALWLRITILEKYLRELQQEVLHGITYANGMTAMRHHSQKYRWEIDHEHVQ